MVVPEPKRQGRIVQHMVNNAKNAPSTITSPNANALTTLKRTDDAPGGTQLDNSNNTESKRPQNPTGEERIIASRDRYIATQGSRSRRKFRTR